MAKILVNISVSRISDTGLEVQEMHRAIWLSPKFTVWSVLMILIGAVSSIELEPNKITIIGE